MTRRGSVTMTIAATMGLLLVAGCSGGPSGPSGPASAPPPSASAPTTGTPPPPSPSPTAMSLEEYRAVVVQTVQPLRSALDDMAGAKSYKNADRALGSVSLAATDGYADLGLLEPPAEVAGLHRRLTGAVSEFGSRAEAVRGDACTAAATRAALGTSKETSELRRATAAVSALLPGGLPALRLPSGRLELDPRPANGAYFRDVKRNGRAYLEVDNNGGTDAVVTLSKGRKPDITVYVRSGRTYRIRNVPEGTYSIFFKSGSAWDKSARGFSRKCAFSRFEDPLRFRTERVAGGVQWQNWEITLSQVFGGNARTRDVNPDEFPE